MVYLKSQIRKALDDFYYIYADGGTYRTEARGGFRNRRITPLVEDEVLFESDNLTGGYMLEISPRRNEPVRPLVANVDLGVVVISMVSPNFSFNLLDRFLVSLGCKDIEPVIYLAKVDLLDEPQCQEVTGTKQIYEALGYAVAASEDVKTTKELGRFFPERLAAFMGQSDAGESTLLNQISPELQLVAAEISQSSGRDRHTTRHVELVPLYDGLVAGTSGFSVIDFLEVETVELPKQFPEFVVAASHYKFRECMHHKGPDCEVKHQVEAGTIAMSRYENHLQFLMGIEDRRPVYKKKS